MHATKLLAIAFAGLSWINAASAQSHDALAEPLVSAPVVVETPEVDATPALIGAGPNMPVSHDPGMFPALRPSAQPRPFLEVHGFTALWVAPMTNEEAPQRAVETFRLRWAILRIDAHPTQHLHVVTRLGLMLDNPLLDASVSWTRLRALNITLGQFRMPLGAAATTLAPQLVMQDRPTYIYAMTKATFRDVGVMFGSGDGGLADGLLHYRLAVASGNGRVAVGDPMRAENARDLLWIGRLIADVGPRIAPGVRLALGGTAAFNRDPALDVTNAAAARATAANLLGRSWTPLGEARDTLLTGADLTFSNAQMWAQAEWMRLSSTPIAGGPARRSTGASLELGYKLPWTLERTTFQVAARGEMVDPNTDVDDDGYTVVSGGLNVLPTPYMRVSAFGQGTFFKDAATGDETVGSEINLRAALAF
jgi:hypothetical protein